MREVTGSDGRNYRVKPQRRQANGSRNWAVQVQDKQPPYHFHNHVVFRDQNGYSAEDLARAWLAVLGRVNEAPPDTREVQL